MPLSCPILPWSKVWSATIMGLPFEVGSLDSAHSLPPGGALHQPKALNLERKLWLTICDLCKRDPPPWSRWIFSRICHSKSALASYSWSISSCTVWTATSSRLTMTQLEATGLNSSLMQTRLRSYPSDPWQWYGQCLSLWIPRMISLKPLSLKYILRN